MQQTVRKLEYKSKKITPDSVTELYFPDNSLKLFKIFQRSDIEMVQIHSIFTVIENTIGVLAVYKYKDKLYISKSSSILGKIYNVKRQFVDNHIRKFVKDYYKVHSSNYTNSSGFRSPSFFISLSDFIDLLKSDKFGNILASGIVDKELYDFCINTLVKNLTTIFEKEDSVEELGSSNVNFESKDMEVLDLVKESKLDNASPEEFVSSHDVVLVYYFYDSNLHLSLPQSLKKVIEINICRMHDRDCFFVEYDESTNFGLSKSEKVIYSRIIDSLLSINYKDYNGNSQSFLHDVKKYLSQFLVDSSTTLNKDSGNTVSDFSNLIPNQKNFIALASPLFDFFKQTIETCNYLKSVNKHIEKDKLKVEKTFSIYREKTDTTIQSLTEDLQKLLEERVKLHDDNLSHKILIDSLTTEFEEFKNKYINVISESSTEINMKDEYLKLTQEYEELKINNVSKEAHIILAQEYEILKNNYQKLKNSISNDDSNNSLVCKIQSLESIVENLTKENESLNYSVESLKRKMIAMINT